MINILKNSIANLKGHKLRIIVAFIWIIVGITSVIFISSLGNAMKIEVSKSFDKIKPNEATITFNPNTESSGGAVQAMVPFRQSDLSEISFIDGVDYVKPLKDPFPSVTPTNYITASASYGKNSVDIEVNYYKDASNKVKILAGRNLNSSDNNRNTIILPLKKAQELMRDLDYTSIGRGVTIHNKIYEVVGIYDDSIKYDPTEKKFVDTNEMYGDLSYVYMSKDTYNGFMDFNTKTNEIGSIRVKVLDGFDTSEVADNVTAKLSELHSDIVGEYKVEDRNSIEKQLNSITGGIDKFVKIITVIAMCVGGIGIMNIMYVSVMERSREIGIRRALGAKKRDVIFQFLIESTFITTVGGILGIVIGICVTWYSRSLMPFKPVFSFVSIIYAVVAIILTGVIFGLVPAIKASNMDPIEAIYK